MPTYQYACTECGHRLEAVQSFSDDPLTECPVCGGRLRKVFSAVGVVFKGSGFYRTDSRSAGSKDGKSDRPAKEGTKPAAKDGGSSGSGSSGSGSSGSGSSGSGSSGSGSGSSGSGSSGSGSSSSSSTATKSA